MSLSASPPAGAVALPGRTILGHPAGLYVLFFTEMWERMSYYGMRALLVLYMVNHLFVYPDVGARVLGFTALKHGLESIFGPLGAQPLSSQIYGLYTAFVYLTPFFGGMLADKVLGQRRAVILGAILMAIGHFLMASERLFFPALMFLIAGNGAFKPNISTQVGGLYPVGDSRRDQAFTIFYMGINVGAMLSPLVCGTLGQKVGWHYGFAAAGVGMVLGLCLYVWGRKYLAKEPSLQTSSNARSIRYVSQYIIGTFIGLIVVIVLLPTMLGLLPVFIRWLFLAAVIVAVSWFFARWMRSMVHDDRLRVGALCVLCALNIVFWGCYEQQGNTMQLWADQNTNWKILGWEMPSTWFQSFNPIMICAFAPLLNMFWSRQAKRGKEPDSVQKMAIGCFLLGLSYIVMIVAAQGMTPDTRRHVMWLAGTTFVITIGELYLSPIGLSLVTKVAPVRMVSMMMGIWFLSSFFGNYLSGFLGTYWEKMPHTNFFVMLTLLGLTAGFAMLAFSKPIRRVVSRHE